MSILLELKEELQNKHGFFTRAITEIGAIGLALEALVETVAYSVLAVIHFLGGGACTRKIIDHPVQHLASSAFTFYWTVTTALFSNIFWDDLESDESLARVRLNCCFLPLLRERDREYIANTSQQKAQEKWQKQLERAISKSGFSRSEELLSYNTLDYLIRSDGTRFLLELLRGTDVGTKESFMRIGPEVFDFIFSKAIFEYTLGSRRRVVVLPPFLKFETRTAILDLRDDQECQRDKDHLKAYFCAKIQDGTALEKSLATCPESLRKLKVACSAEYQAGGALLSTCWEQAIKALEAEGVS